MKITHDDVGMTLKRRMLVPSVLAAILVAAATGCDNDATYGDLGRVCGNDISAPQCSCDDPSTCTVCVLRDGDDLCLRPPAETLCLPGDDDFVFAAPDDDGDITIAGEKNFDEEEMCVLADVDIVGLAQPFFEDILEVEGNLRITESSIGILEMPRLVAVGGDLVIGRDPNDDDETGPNPNLDEISFPELAFVGGRFVVTGNPSLALADARALAGQLCACDDTIPVAICENGDATAICRDRACDEYDPPLVGSCPQ